MPMALKLLFPLWASALVAITTMLISILIYLYTGFFFILFILPVPFLLFRWDRDVKNR
jgi:hypothetical protein